MMRRRLLFGLIGWLVIASWTVSAQEPELPPVLDPRDVFTDAVAVVETKPILGINDWGHVAYYDPVVSDWTLYPYPEDMIEISAFRLRSDGMYLIGGQNSPFTFFEFDLIWLFNPFNETFTHPTSACGWIRDLPGEGTWQVVQNSDIERYYLCHTETDERLGPLPDNLQVEPYPFRRVTTVSPDQAWIVFQTDLSGNVQIMGYEMETGKLQIVGQIEDTDFVEFGDWIDNHHLMLRASGSTCALLSRISILDVTEANSLKYLDPEFPLWPEYFSDPPHYEWVIGAQHECAEPFDVPDNEWEERCKFHVFYPESMETVSYPAIPGICGTGIPIRDGSGDRLYNKIQHHADGSEIATLTRFNPINGKVEVLYEGPIVTLDWWIDDGRYATLVLDENALELFDGREYDLIRLDYLSSLVSPSVAIFDLQTHQIAYQTPATRWPYEGVYPRVVWLTDDQFLLEEALDANNRILQLNDGEPVETPLGRYANVRYGEAAHAWIWEAGFSNDRSVYDITNDDMISILKPAIHEMLDSGRYKMAVGQEYDGLLPVRIIDQARTHHTGIPFALGDWRIRVP